MSPLASISGSTAKSRRRPPSSSPQIPTPKYFSQFHLLGIDYPITTLYSKGMSTSNYQTSTSASLAALSPDDLDAIDIYRENRHSLDVFAKIRQLTPSRAMAFLCQPHISKALEQFAAFDAEELSLARFRANIASLDALAHNLATTNDRKERERISTRTLRASRVPPVRLPCINGCCRPSGEQRTYIARPDPIRDAVAYVYPDGPQYARPRPTSPANPPPPSTPPAPRHEASSDQNTHFRANAPFTPTDRYLQHAPLPARRASDLLLAFATQLFNTHPNIQTAALTTLSTNLAPGATIDGLPVVLPEGPRERFEAVRALVSTCPSLNPRCHPTAGLSATDIGPLITSETPGQPASAGQGPTGEGHKPAHALAHAPANSSEARHHASLTLTFAPEAPPATSTNPYDDPNPTHHAPAPIRSLVLEAVRFESEPHRWLLSAVTSHNFAPLPEVTSPPAPPNHLSSA